MSKCVLTYFNVRARAEVARMMFAIGGIPYDDIRLKMVEWQKIREKSPFGQLPLLEVDGKVICQSNAIERYLANKLDLAGDTAWDKARVDMIVACLEDTWSPATQIFRQTDPQLKEDMRYKYRKEQLPFYLKKFDDFLPKGDHFFLGNKLSWADLKFATIMDAPGDFAGVPVPWEKEPRLKAVIDGVYAHPKIAEWTAKRPKTPR